MSSLCLIILSTRKWWCAGLSSWWILVCSSLQIYSPVPTVDTVNFFLYSPCSAPLLRTFWRWRMSSKSTPRYWTLPFNWMFFSLIVTFSSGLPIFLLSMHHHDLALFGKLPTWHCRFWTTTLERVNRIAVCINSQCYLLPSLSGFGIPTLYVHL